MRAAVALGAVLLGSCASRSAQVDAVRVADVEGRTWLPLVPDGTHCSVLVFLTHESPHVDAYASELRAIVKQHAGDPVRFWFVHVARNVTVTAARRHAELHHLPGTILLDREHALVRALAATTTPEAFVLDRNGKTVYRGRIDDAYPGLGTRRTNPTSHDLRDAILATLRGRAIAVTVTAPVGAAIE